MPQVGGLSVIELVQDLQLFLGPLIHVLIDFIVQVFPFFLVLVPALDRLVSDFDLAISVEIRQEQAVIIKL